MVNNTTSPTHLQLVVLFARLDPVLALALRVNQQGVAGGLRYDDAVLGGQLIVGQALQIPLSNLDE